MFSWNSLECGYSKLPIVALPEACLKPGTILFLFGRNGSGKSTALLTLGGVLPALAGEIRFKNELLTERLPIGQRPALLSAQNLINPHLTGRDLIDLFEVNKSNWYDLEKISHFQPANLERRFVSQLSSGELQRLLLALTLSHPSEIVLLDEPTTYIDFPFAHALSRIIAQDAAKGRIFIIACHDFNWALRFKEQRGWVIASSKVVEMNSVSGALISEQFQVTFQMSTQIIPSPLDEFDLLALTYR